MKIIKIIHFYTNLLYVSKMKMNFDRKISKRIEWQYMRISFIRRDRVKGSERGNKTAIHKSQLSVITYVCSCDVHIIMLNSPK